jgi:hypothetical protein
MILVEHDFIARMKISLLMLDFNYLLIIQQFSSVFAHVMY